MARCRLLCALVFLAFTVDAVDSQPPAVDLQGDPLPPGAIGRLGTTRFRHDTNIVFAAFLPGGGVISVGGDGTACVWEFPSGKEIRRFRLLPGKGEATRGVSVAVLSPDGKTLASASGPAARAKGAKKAFGAVEKTVKAEPSLVRVHDVATGKELQLLKTEGTEATGLIFSPHGRHLTTWHRGELLRIWDWASGKEIGRTSAAGGVSPLTARSASALLLSGTFAAAAANRDAAVVYSPDGKTLLLYGGSKVLQFLDADSAKDVGPSAGHTAPLTAIWFTPDGDKVLTQDARVTRLWDAASSKGLGALLPPAELGSPTVYSPDGRSGVTVARFATPADARAAKEREAILFDALTGKKRGVIGLEAEIAPMHRRPLVFSPDGTLLAAAAGTDKDLIHLYDTASGKLLRVIDTGTTPAGKAGFGSLANSSIRMLFAPGGKILAYQAGPQTPVSWFEVATGRKLGSVTLTEAARAAQLGAITPDGRCLALHQVDGALALVELATGKPRRTFRGAALPEGDDVEDRIAALLAGDTIATRAKPNFAFSRDGRLLALGGADGTIPIVDVLSGKELARLKGHAGIVNALAFAPNGKTLASASADATALLWDMTQIARPRPAAKAPRPADLDAWWQALEDDDAGKAFAALGELVTAPDQAVSLIRERVQPAQRLDEKRVEALIKQLGDTGFKTRELATAELLKMGDQLLPILARHLKASPVPEAQRRLDILHTRLSELRGERLRAYRAVEVLERIATPAARAELARLAGGAPGAVITTSAAKALHGD